MGEEEIVYVESFFKEMMSSHLFSLGIDDNWAIHY